MAPHSSTLAWKIPWTEEPGRLHSMGSLRVGHDWATSLLLFTFMHWRRKWQPTPVFLPGESQGRGSLVGCRLRGHRVGHDWSYLAAAAAARLIRSLSHFFPPWLKKINFVFCLFALLFVCNNQGFTWDITMMSFARFLRSLHFFYNECWIQKLE